MSKFATIINNNVVWQIVNDMNSSSCPPLRDYSFGNHKNNNEETEEVALLLLVILPTMAVYRFTKEKV